MINLKTETIHIQMFTSCNDREIHKIEYLSLGTEDVCKKTSLGDPKTHLPYRSSNQYGYELLLSIQSATALDIVCFLRRIVSFSLCSLDQFCC